MRTYPVPEELPPLLLDEPELELDLLLVKLIQLLGYWLQIQFSLKRRKGVTKSEFPQK